MFNFITQELLRSESPAEDHIQGDPMDECQSDPQISETKDLNELADIYWVCSFMFFPCRKISWSH